MDQVKELREKTGVSVMQCRKALEDAGGDMEKALVLLQKKSAEIASKKSDRTLGAGTAQAYVHAGGSVCAVVTLLSETDFVGKNEEFRAIARDIAMHVAALSPKYISFEKVPAEEQVKVKEVFAEEVKSSGKPAEIQEKMLSGKLETYFKEQALLDQPFVKNPDITVRTLIEQAIQKFGERIEVGTFARYSI